MALNFRLSFTTAGLERVTPRSSNLALIASNLSNMLLTYFYGHCSRRTIINKVCKGNYFKAYMTYRKLKATGLFTGHTMLDESAVLIISVEGEVLDLLLAYESDEDV